MAVVSKSKTKFIAECNKLFVHTFKRFADPRNEIENYDSECEDFIIRVRNQIQAIVRDQYRNKGGFKDRDQMYEFAAEELKIYYRDPYRLIIQVLD